jgi:four helix bundle protein
MIKSYKDLDIFKGSYKLWLYIYKITSKYPKDEIYGITSQLRRAAVSIPLNIAEGYGRLSEDDFKRFLRISLGSTNETSTLIEISKDLGYINNKEYSDLIKQYNILGRKIYRFMENLTYIKPNTEHKTPNT